MLYQCQTGEMWGDGDEGEISGDSGRISQRYLARTHGQDEPRGDGTRMKKLVGISKCQRGESNLVS